MTADKNRPVSWTTERKSEWPPPRPADFVLRAPLGVGGPGPRLRGPLVARHLAAQLLGPGVVSGDTQALAQGVRLLQRRDHLAQPLARRRHQDDLSAVRPDAL